MACCGPRSPLPHLRPSCDGLLWCVVVLPCPSRAAGWLLGRAAIRPRHRRINRRLCLRVRRARHPRR
uniref:Uncharacterized protein n=1 Tax=Oryza nivara TaxID=4536 RepID=A0A0E0HYV3_ORYNI